MSKVSFGKRLGATSWGVFANQPEVILEPHRDNERTIVLVVELVLVVQLSEQASALLLIIGAWKPEFRILRNLNHPIG